MFEKCVKAEECLMKSVIDRYYIKKYKKDEVTGEDLCVLLHSNRIFLVTLAARHPIIKENKSILSFNFKINNVDRLENKVSGKNKKGGQNLNNSAALCCIKCEDGSEYCIKLGVKCSLIQINQRLIEDPNLIFKNPSEGYIAILLTKPQDHEKQMAKLMSEEDYENSFENF